MIKGERDVGAEGELEQLQGRSELDHRDRSKQNDGDVQPESHCSDN